MVSTGVSRLPTDVTRRASAGAVRAEYVAAADHTWPARIHESGGLRLRHVKGTSCEAVLVNTAGGVVAGDTLALSFNLAAGATLTATSAAAEKIYRSDGRETEIRFDLTLAAAAKLIWLPQETILFDGSRIRRRFEVSLAESATFVAAEMTVFGRLAHGERDPVGSLHDSWRIRRDGRLVFADETRLEGAVGAVLDRGATARGARATAVVLLVSPHAALALDPVRESLSALQGTAVEGGASVRDGVLHARLVSRAPDQLRAATIAVVQAVHDLAMPRSWA